MKWPSRTTRLFNDRFSRTYLADEDIVMKIQSFGQIPEFYGLSWMWLSKLRACVDYRCPGKALRRKSPNHAYVVSPFSTSHRSAMEHCSPWPHIRKIVSLPDTLCLITNSRRYKDPHFTTLCFSKPNENIWEQSITLVLPYLSSHRLCGHYSIILQHGDQNQHSPSALRVSFAL